MILFTLILTFQDFCVRKINYINMKYTGTTVSKPVTGKSAERLVRAVKAGTYVSNDAARNTIQQIIEVRKEQVKTDAAKNKI